MKMKDKTISTAKLEVNQIPQDDVSVDGLIQFAHTFDGYACWGSFERCAEIANTHDHSTIDALRTCLFFEARRWRHFGETPDDEALFYWRKLVKDIRALVEQRDSTTPEP